jgi:spore coat polysaccharide biosynthesis protein SpsF
LGTSGAEQPAAPVDTAQLQAWQGEFGRAYTERNVGDWRRRVPAFRQMLAGLDLRRVLEVGCNRGHNLVTIGEILGPGAEVVGVEPNLHALALARQAGARVLEGHALALPFADRSFDMVFTAGVLIHVSLRDLPTALREIHRVSDRYVLAIEYFAAQETAVEYRGRQDLLWKRDFVAHYQGQFPSLRVLRHGYFGPENGFDRTHWWLLEKVGDAAR